jgi:hypothetical protein
MRPEVGTQPQFRKKKPPATYRYDSSLSPALNWDSQNPARELGEWLLDLIGRAAALDAPHAFDRPQEFKTASGAVVATVRTLAEAVDLLERLGQPFLDWTGKAERLSFDVPTLPGHRRLRAPPRSWRPTATSRPAALVFGPSTSPSSPTRRCSSEKAAEMSLRTATYV